MTDGAATGLGQIAASEPPRSEQGRSVFSPIRKTGLTESVYQRLRSEIIAARLPPGELLTLDDLAARYGVSRTPVREALRRLEAEELVLFREHRRVQVAPLSLDEIEGTYALRILTEGFAVSQSVKNGADEISVQAGVAYDLMVNDASAGDSESFYRHHLDFHRAIYSGTGSLQLERLTEDLRTRTDRHRHVHAHFRLDYLHVTADAHARILKACQAADPEAAAELVIEHLYETATTLLAQAGTPTGSAYLDAALGAALRGLAQTKQVSDRR